MGTEAIRRSRWRSLLGFSTLAVLAVAAAQGWVPVVLAAACGAISVVAFFMYWFDKSAARRGSRRTPESSLQLVAFLGGWPGALIGQQWLRHKTAKRSFQQVFWTATLLNIAVATWFIKFGLPA